MNIASNVFFSTDPEMVQLWTGYNMPLDPEHANTLQRMCESSYMRSTYMICRYSQYTKEMWSSVSQGWIVF